MVILSQHVPALPLVFTATKTVKQLNENSKVPLEVAVIDTSKYEKVRVSAVFVSERTNTIIGNFYIHGMEEPDTFFYLDTLRTITMDNGSSIVIDAPPSRIKLSTYETGTYRIYMWGK
jgi:hypothetical protein